jgi:hypothetical protein
MSKLTGSWTFTLVRPAGAPGACPPPSAPRRSAAGGAADALAAAALAAAAPEGWPLSRVQYRFAMWPKGVPRSLRRLPGLMDAVQGAVARESGQMLDKIAFVEAKVRQRRRAAAGAKLAVCLALLARGLRPPPNAPPWT